MLTIGEIYDIIYTNTGGRYIQTLTEEKTDDIPQENTGRVAFVALTEEFTMKSTKLLLSAIFLAVWGSAFLLAASRGGNLYTISGIGAALSLTSIVLFIKGLCTRGAKSDTESQK